jgi:hypothetical protein
MPSRVVAVLLWAVVNLFSSLHGYVLSLSNEIQHLLKPNRATSQQQWRYWGIPISIE